MRLFTTAFIVSLSCAIPKSTVPATLAAFRTQWGVRPFARFNDKDTAMKAYLRLTTLAAFIAASGAAFAQTGAHHPNPNAPQAPLAAPGPTSTPGSMPEQCTAMMSMMQTMMPMMQKMMPMMQDGMMQGMPMATANMSDATKAYMEAMQKMDGPMMQGVQGADPDVAFVQVMIPHHQGAIDMARTVLQFGKDDEVKAWANDIITAQESEIAKMQDWLKQHAKMGGAAQ
jgi:hypothetical protein